MRTYTLIVNPSAGGGKARKILPDLERQLRSWGVLYEVRETRAPGEATDLAAEATGEVVISVGGDGTINEVLNGLPPGKLLGIVAAGSGNDMVKSLPIPRRPLEALETAVYGKPVAVDVGTVDCTAGAPTGGPGGENGEREPGKGESRGRFFLNGVGVGFDAEVAVRKGEIGYLTGLLVYVAAVLETLGKYRAPVFHVQADSLSRSSKQLLIAIGNGRCAGGGFYLTPQADPSDGLLDVCLIDNVGIGTILRLMPKVMAGRHGGHPTVRFTRTREVRLESVTPFYVHADGEIVGRRVNSVRIGILPARVSVMVRPGSR